MRAKAGNAEFEGSSLNLTGITKKLTGTPTITVGSVGLKGPDIMAHLRGTDRSERNSRVTLEQKLNRDEFELVAIGRALAAVVVGAQ